MSVATKTTEDTPFDKDVDSHDSSPTSVDATSFKSMLGMTKKKPRAEYQSEIDELKAENERLTAELEAIKDWLKKAPKV